MRHIYAMLLKHKRLSIFIVVGLVSLVIAASYSRYLTNSLEGARSLEVVVTRIPDKTSDEDLATILAGDFEIIYGLGGGGNGYDILRVSSSGMCTYQYKTWIGAQYNNANSPWLWRKAVFTLGNNDLAGLKLLLVQNQVFKLDKQYLTNVLDTEEIFLYIKGNIASKFVYCNNSSYAPAALNAFDVYVKSRILSERHPDINKDVILDEQHLANDIDILAIFREHGLISRPKKGISTINRDEKVP